MTNKKRSTGKAARDTLLLLGANLVALAVFAAVTPGLDVPWWLVLVFFFFGKLIQDLRKHRKST